MDSAKQDADVLIVQTTGASAQTKDTILVGAVQICLSFFCIMLKWIEMAFSFLLRIQKHPKHPKLKRYGA